jgi:transcriptional regulator with XRE-family HTH domain
MTNEFTRDPRLADGIGKALTETRIGAGIGSQVEFAALTGLTRPKISRLEGGRVVPRPDEVLKWAQVAELDDERTQALLDILAEYTTWRADLDRRIQYGVAGDEIAYTDTFKATRKVRTFAALELPSYLQVDDYAKASIELASPGAPDDEREEALRARMERAEYLNGSAREFTVVIAEPALRWQVSDPDVMRAQIGHLFKYLRHEHIHLWVLPLANRPAVIPRQSFTIHDEKFVVVEMYGGAATFRQQEPRRHAEVFRQLVSASVSGDDARDLLTAATAAIPGRSARRR